MASSSGVLLTALLFAVLSDARGCFKLENIAPYIRFKVSSQPKAMNLHRRNLGIQSGEGDNAGLVWI